jgi:hypothetical protein
LLPLRTVKCDTTQNHPKPNELTPNKKHLYLAICAMSQMLH